MFIDGCHFHDSALIINLCLQGVTNVILIIPEEFFVNNTLEQRLKLCLALTSGRT